MATPSWGLLPCARASAQIRREGTTCTCSCPPCVTRATATTAAWAPLKLYKRAALLRAPTAHPMTGRGLLGSFLGVPWEQSHSPGRCWVQPRRWETAASALFVLGGFSPGTQAASQPLYAQQKGGTSVPSRIANQAALAATAAATCAPLRATIGSSGAGRQDFCGLGKGPRHPPCADVPSPRGMHCGLLPFPQERMGAARCREQEVAAERLLAPDSDPTRLP